MSVYSLLLTLPCPAKLVPAVFPPVPSCSCLCVCPPVLVVASYPYALCVCVFPSMLLVPSLFSQGFSVFSIGIGLLLQVYCLWNFSATAVKQPL